MTDADALTAMQARIIERIMRFGHDELEVLDLIAARLDMGRTQYGELQINTDRRDWIDELVAEILDASVYSSIELIRARRKQKS